MPRPSLRETILESAVTEFHRLGFAACSVDHIAKAAGVPKGSFYNHFASKEDLGVEVVVRYAAEVGWAAESDAGLTPLDRLRARFRRMADLTVDDGFTHGCLMGNLGAEVADHSPPIRAQVGTGFDAWSTSITASIREAQAAGEVSADLDATRLGGYLLGAFQGALLRARVVRTAEPFDDFFTVTFDTLLR